MNAGLGRFRLFGERGFYLIGNGIWEGFVWEIARNSKISIILKWGPIVEYGRILCWVGVGEGRVANFQSYQTKGFQPAFPMDILVEICC
jgi:hypothetical protein